MNDTVSTAPPVTDATFWAVATIKKGRIVGLVEGYPPGKVAQNEFLLTREEFYFLKAIPPKYLDMRKLRSMATRIQTKINKVEKK